MGAGIRRCSSWKVVGPVVTVSPWCSESFGDSEPFGGSESFGDSEPFGGL